MTISIDQLVDRIVPEKTVLFFGAGSSVPSKGPTSDDLVNLFADRFSIQADGYSLSEITGIAERRSNRRDVIQCLRDRIANLKPHGSILNLPLFEWKSIFTTNYDTLIEQSFEAKDLPFRRYASNFDFTVDSSVPVGSTSIFKLHGSIEQDIVDGLTHRLILTESDYSNNFEYRQYLYLRLATDIAESTLLIIGHSLADPHIRDLLKQITDINIKAQFQGNIILLLYNSDTDRAALLEERGFTVAFGGIDDFFVRLATRKNIKQLSLPLFGDPLDAAPVLRSTTVDVTSVSGAEHADISRMFNGWPASYADIAASFTFERTLAPTVQEFLTRDNVICAHILGAAGVGKTTAARQIVQLLRRDDWMCWEHKGDYPLRHEDWVKVARHCQQQGIRGLLFVDDAHLHLFELNALLEQIAANKLTFFRVLITATKAQWNPRKKSPILYRSGGEYPLSRLAADEIERLLYLVDSQAEVRTLVEGQFSGFSQNERRRRLTERCSADMFVCLKNIFASESFDDIILREYADIGETAQDVYRHVAVLEEAGVQIHRQLLVRLLNIRADTIASLLDSLEDIVSENVISDKDGIYAWQTRHNVIASIISKYKYPNIHDFIDLINHVIDNLSPTFEIEIRTIRQLCNVDTGIPKIPSKETQNTLLRKLMSIAPAERVPRHRLIRNLIDGGQYEKAATEIRIFEKDFQLDGPVWRYKVELLTQRGVRAPGLMPEDREAILNEARDLALQGIEKFPNTKGLLSAYAELGVQYLRLKGSFVVYDEAIKFLSDAENQIGDPDISKIITRFGHRVSNVVSTTNDTP